MAYNNSFLIAYTNNGQFFHYNELYDRFDLFLDLRISFNNTFLSVGKVVIDDEQALWIPTSGGLCKYKNGIFTQISEAPIRTQCITSYDQTHLLVASQDSIRLLNTNTLKQKSICGIEAHVSGSYLGKYSFLFLHNRPERCIAGSPFSSIMAFPSGHLKKKRIIARVLSKIQNKSNRSYSSL